MKRAIAKYVLVCGSILALVTSIAPAFAGEQIKHAPDCEAKMQELDSSSAEGQERLDLKNVVIEFCAAQYKHDKSIDNLVKRCAKYEEQPVVKQQSVAECQLAAFNYANALRTLKAEYGK